MFFDFVRHKDTPGNPALIYPPLLPLTPLKGSGSGSSGVAQKDCQMKVKDFWFTFSNICLSHTRCAQPPILRPATTTPTLELQAICLAISLFIPASLPLAVCQTIKCCRFWLGKLDRQLCAWLSLKMPASSSSYTLPVSLSPPPLSLCVFSRQGCFCVALAFAAWWGYLLVGAA